MLVEFVSAWVEVANERRSVNLARASVLLICCALLTTLGCGPSAPYVWVNDVEQAQGTQNTFVIAPGDTLSIRVFGDETVSTEAVVRSDGVITLLLIGDVLAAGKTPPVLADELQTLLAKFLTTPRVVVGVSREVLTPITVLGEVAEQGLVELPRNSGLMQALAASGGFTDYADRDQIYVIRQNPRVRIRFSFDDLIANDPRATGFVLLKGDVVYVE